MTPSFTTRGRTICSVSPFKLPRQERPYSPNPRGGMSVYQVDPYTLEERDRKAPPHIVPISDCFQAQRDVWQGIGYPGQHTTPQFVTVEKIASDILDHWSIGRLGAPADSGPGVFLCEALEPSQEEIAAAFRRQERYMVFLYEQALEFYNNKLLVNISLDHRLASNWLRRDEVWAKTGPELSKDRCPLCQSVVPAEAYVCASCGNTIRELPTHLAKLNPQAVPIGAGVGESKAPRPVNR